MTLVITKESEEDVNEMLDAIRQTAQEGMFQEKDPQRALQEISGEVAKVKKVLREGMFVTPSGAKVV